MGSTVQKFIRLLELGLEKSDGEIRKGQLTHSAFLDKNRANSGLQTMCDGYGHETIAEHKDNPVNRTLRRPRNQLDSLADIPVPRLANRCFISCESVIHWSSLREELKTLTISHGVKGTSVNHACVYI